MSRVALSGAVAVIGLLVLGLILGFLELEPREAVLTVAALGTYGVAFATRRPLPVLLFAWVLALTYGKAFFVYPSADSPDFHGIYWIYSDVFLSGVLLIWFRRGPSSKPSGWMPGRAVWPWLLPLVLAAALSTLAAIRSDWALFDLLRIFKLVLVVACLRANLGVSEWWACVNGLVVGTAGQGVLSIMQVALKNTSGGLLGMLGIGDAAQAAQAQVQTQAMQGAMGGWFRAYGTIGHPANLAAYFLFTVPVLLGLTFTVRRPGQRLLSACALIIGLAGLACTQSRGPWMFGAVQIAILLIALVFYKLTSARAVIAISGIALLLAAGVGYRFEDFIVERFNRDYDDSVKLREGDNLTALRIFADSPLVGVGPNNYSAKILDYDPSWSWAFQGVADFQRQFKTRLFVAPHDLYAFLLAEMGILGLLGFLILIAGCVWLGYCGARDSNGPEKAVCIGLILGIFGQLAQSAINFSLWVDPLFYTLALCAALLARAPLAGTQPVAIPAQERSYAAV
jgi:O-antigen ligase